MSELLTIPTKPNVFQTNITEKLNNNPLAHVNLLLEQPGSAEAEQRIKLEFITDMGERLENQPFRTSYNYRYDGNEIIYDTGILYLQTLKNSCIAAQQDVNSGNFPQYHLDRQIAFYRQGEIIKNWLDNKSDCRHLLLFSLCPTPSELTEAEAKKQSFKPERKMASIQLHSKNNDGTMTTTAFSLDMLTPQRLQSLFDSLGVNAVAAKDTMSQLTMPILIDSSYDASDAIDKIIDTYDQNLHIETDKLYKQGIDIEQNVVEANSFVRQHAEVYQLYRGIISEVVSSLNTRKVTPDLQGIVYKQLVLAYRNTNVQMPAELFLNAGDIFTKKQASELVEYLRKKAIPEYLTQKLRSSQASTRDNSMDNNYGDGGGVSIGSAGASAQSSGRSYDGGCPTSANPATGQQGQGMSASEQARQMGLNKNTIVKYQYTKGYCVVPNCPTSKFDYKVMVGPCSVCRDCQENLYDKGIDAVKHYEPSFMEILGEMFGVMISEIFGEKNDKTTKKDKIKMNEELKRKASHDKEKLKMHSRQKDYDLAA